MRSIIAAIVIVGFFGTSLRAYAQMSSTNYKIRWDTIGNGGDDVSSSASYILRDTAGGAAIGNGSSDSYELGAGYRQGVFDQVIDFSLFAQNSNVINDASAVSGTTITCSTSHLSVGDMVALVQDVGANQVSAIGRITSVGMGFVTVDEFVNAGTMPVIDGNDDEVVQLSGSTAELGSLLSGVVRTSVIGWDVRAEVDDGYVVQVVADGDFRDGVKTIDAVADGAVTAGSEEYGARSSDTTVSGSTFDTQDTALTTTFQDVADASSAAFSDRNFLTLKVAVDGSTSSGDYGQTLTFVVSGNY